MCVINGIISPENNTFTHIHATGSSVVAYICTFHDNLDNCKYIYVHLMRSLLDKIRIYTDKIPDHSVLEFDLLSHFMGVENNIAMPGVLNVHNVIYIPQSNNDETI